MMQSQGHNRFRQFTRVVLFALALVALAPLGLGSATTHAQGEPTGILHKATGKLSTRLERLAQPDLSTQSSSEQARTLGVASDGPGSLMRNAAGDVLVYIRLANTSDAQVAALGQAGARVVHVAREYNVVTAYVPANRLNGIAALRAVQNVHEELAPLHHATTRPARPTRGSAAPQADCPTATISEGDTQMNVAAGRAAYNVDGSGIVVGVVSDSYNKDTSLATDALDDIANGDLPGAGNPCGRATPITVLAEDSGDSSTDEGRAMLHIVHDLAPGAGLAFATANNGLFSFADNVRALRSQAGASVIVDDVSYFSEPFFQDGPVGVAIKNVATNGALYTTAAGNDNLIDVDGNNITSYETAAYRPTVCPALLGNDGPTNAYAADCHAFDPTDPSSSSSGFLLDAGAQFILLFQWAEPWFGVTTDLDIILADQAGNVLAYSNDTNNGTGSQAPFEGIQYSNSTGVPQIVSLIVARADGAATPRFKHIFVSARGVLAAEFDVTSNTTDVFGPAIYGHAGAAEALSTAAVPYDDDTTPEEFSSFGPRTVYFGPMLSATPAKPLPLPVVRIKPDVAATDGNQNPFFGQPDGGVYRFYGTSAAAPHAAAVAALLKQLANQRGALFNYGTLDQILSTTASPLAGGTPQSSGAGLINAASALEAATGLQPPRKTYLPLAVR